MTHMTSIYMNAKWCISATRSQNYYDSYTRQGKAFYFILNKNLNDDSKYRKIALVYDKNGEFEEFFDVEDEGYTDDYELIRILFYNLIAPAIKQNPDYPLKDEFVDMIAGALLDGDSLEAFLGSDDPEEMNEEDVKLYEDIVKYLQGLLRISWWGSWRFLVGFVAFLKGFLEGLGWVGALPYIVLH